MQNMDEQYKELQGKLQPEHLEKLKALEERTTKIFTYCIREASERMNREDSSPLDVYQLLHYALKASSLPFPSSEKLRGVCLNNLGAFYHSLGDYQAAHPCLLDAVKLNQRNQAGNGKDLQLAKMHLNLGTTLLSMGKNKLALRYSQRAWLLLQQQLKQSEVAAAAAEEAAAEKEVELSADTDEDLDSLEEHPEISESRRSRKPPSLANPSLLTGDTASDTERLALLVECTHRIALCHEKLKDFRDALLWYGESVKRAQTLLPPSHPVLALLQQAQTNAGRELRRFELRYRRKEKEKKQAKERFKWGTAKAVGAGVSLSPALRDLEVQRQKHERQLARQLATASAAIRARREGTGSPQRFPSPSRRSGASSAVTRGHGRSPEHYVSESRRAVELYAPVKPAQQIPPNGVGMRSPKGQVYQKQSSPGAPLAMIPTQPTSRPHSAEAPPGRSSNSKKAPRKLKSAGYHREK
mmetsp:Transcript_27584/g.35833  ORF Transcript_27584/g.35833 Transcript_27584/m.35833 type:complete len:469 (+) Transcript_27584:235-1641(+)